VTVDDHPDFEDLSAYHDGEAPEWAAHVAVCDACNETVKALASLTAAVAEPLPATPLAGAEASGAPDPVGRAAAAVAAASTDPEAPEGRAGPPPAAAPPLQPAPVPSRGRWLAAAVAAAAVVVVVAGLTTVLRRSTTPDSTTTAAGRPQSTELARPETAVGGPAPPADSAADSPATAVVGGDLGDVPDAATLLAKVGPLLASGRGAAGVPAAPPVRSSVPGVPDVPEPRVVGTRPCEIEARAGRASLGDVVYVATASSGGRPAVVLGFAPASGVGPVTVEMLTTSGCQLLLEATTP
jgi:hypothetical protein